MTNEEKRRDRINKIYNTVKDCAREGKTCNKNKLIALMGVEYGLSNRVINEYILQLIISDKIKDLKNGELGLWENETQAKLEFDEVMNGV